MPLTPPQPLNSQTPSRNKNETPIDTPPTHLIFFFIFSYLSRAHTHTHTSYQVLSIRNKDIAGFLKLPPVKLHCSMLAEDAIKAAVRDYKAKSEKSKAQTISIDRA